MAYLPRTVDSVLDELMLTMPAVALDGPKGVGKTDTASRRADEVWRLDDPEQAELLRADFGLKSLPSTGGILFDEWQRVPSIWDSVRRQVDDGATPGRFLLTGSATPSNAQGTHSGAGRIVSLRMRPMGLHERGLTEPTVSLKKLLYADDYDVGGSSDFLLEDYAAAIVSSGFPATLHRSVRFQRDYLDSYLTRVIDRDIPELGMEIRKPATLRRWLRAYAAATSTTASYARILDSTTGADGMQPAKSTTITYRDHLTQLWLLDPIPGWLPLHNAFTLARQSPKHQLADPALAANLLRLTRSALLSPAGSYMAGPLFESLVTLGVRSMAQAAEATVHHLRTKNGEREIDLIVEGYDGHILAIEVKLAPAVTDYDVRHLRWLRDQMPEQVNNLVVITTGRRAYRRSDGVAVVPLALLGL